MAEKTVRASTSAMGKLHEKLAAVMSEALDGESFTDEEGVVTTYKPSNPALFTAVAKFLKDNDVVMIPETEDAVSRLKEQLNNRQKSKLPVASKEDVQWPQERAMH